MSQDMLDKKQQRLHEIVRDLGSVAVAYSGGADSALMVKVAYDVLGAENVVAVTGRSDSLAKRELAQAKIVAREIGVEHVLLDTDEFDNANYTSNPVNRCYFCKTTLYSHLGRFAGRRGTATIVNGINADDGGDFRPGMAAAREHNVRSPLAEAGLTKEDVRALSRRLGLPTHDKPASPCLSSRVPHGQSITPEKLRMIEEAEAFLHDLGVRQCRVRHHDNMARIEVPAERIPFLADPQRAGRIDRHFRSLGYDYVCLDLRGFRSGSLNEMIALNTAGSSA